MKSLSRKFHRRQISEWPLINGKELAFQNIRSWIPNPHQKGGGSDLNGKLVIGEYPF